MSDTYLPQDVTGLGIAFGGNVKKLMPEYATIPAEFKGEHNYWCEWQSDWFFNGLEGDRATPTPKTGIDQKKAMRHLAAIQRSFEPSHEHKSAAVAYLASLWFETPKRGQRRSHG